MNSVLGTVRWGRGGVVALVVVAWVVSGSPTVAVAAGPRRSGGAGVHDHGYAACGGVVGHGG